MRIIYYIHDLYWNRLLGGLYQQVAVLLDENTELEWLEPLFKAGITLLMIAVIYEIYLRIRAAVNDYRIRKSMAGHDVREPHTVKDSSFVEELDAAQYPVHTLEMLKKDKRYDRIADIHAKLNQPEEAARWYIKDRQYARAAEELAKAGKTLQAAKLLKRIGDYTTAARFFTGLGRHKQAAAAYLKTDNPIDAAAAYAQGGYVRQAAGIFQRYFDVNTDPLPLQEAAADKCYHFLEKGRFADQLSTEQRNALFKAVAKRFLAAGRSSLAARAFQEAGETQLASEVYKRIAKVQHNASELPPHAPGKPR
jgi:hypothetical protein